MLWYLSRNFQCSVPVPSFHLFKTKCTHRYLLNTSRVLQRPLQNQAMRVLFPLNTGNWQTLCWDERWVACVTRFTWKEHMRIRVIYTVIHYSCNTECCRRDFMNSRALNSSTHWLLFLLCCWYSIVLRPGRRGFGTPRAPIWELRTCSKQSDVVATAKHGFLRTSSGYKCSLLRTLGSVRSETKRTCTLNSIMQCSVAFYIRWAILQNRFDCS